MDSRTWWAAIHRVAKSWTWLKRLSMHAGTHIQMRILSGGKSYLWTSLLPGVGEGNIFNKWNWCPDFRKKGGEQRANCLQLEIFFMWKWHLGWHILIPFTMISSGFVQKLGCPAVLVRIGWLVKDRCQGLLPRSCGKDSDEPVTKILASC